MNTKIKKISVWHNFLFLYYKYHSHFAIFRSGPQEYIEEFVILDMAYVNKM
jgi:hypothetical protein